MSDGKAQAFAFFRENVKYLDDEQAQKIADENKSLTIKAWLAGHEAANARIKELELALSGKTFSFPDELIKANERIAELESGLAVASKALAFYENVSRLMMDVRDCPKGVKSQSIMDNGDRARLALSKLKRGGEQIFKLQRQLAETEQKYKEQLAFVNMKLDITIKENNDLFDRYEALLDRANKFESGLAVAVEALEFYACNAHWSNTDMYSRDKIRADDLVDNIYPHSIGGLRAREALSKLNHCSLNNGETDE